MNMTMEQEAQFLKEHERDIQRLVRRYQQKAGRRYPDNTEDLRQEAR
ncbi:MAG: hypothetical protein IJP78_06005 [Clostridia bacterium]|nr:hypothetical protein [Clostridia bacterium]